MRPCLPVAAIAVTLAASAPATANGAEPGGRFASCTTLGCYRAGLFVPASSLGGDFDGKRALVSSQVALGLPSVKWGTGVGALFAFGGPTSWLEFRYERSWHQTALGDAHATGMLQAASVDWKMVLGRGPVAPFLIAGWIPYVELQLPRDAVLASGAVGPARFRRVLKSWELGGGLEVHLGGPVWLEALVAYRHVSFEEAHWPGGEWASTGNGISASGARASLGAAFEF